MTPNWWPVLLSFALSGLVPATAFAQAPCERLFDPPQAPGEPPHCMTPQDLAVGELATSRFVVETAEEPGEVVVTARWNAQTEYSHIVVRAVRAEADHQGLPEPMRWLDDEPGSLYGAVYAARVSPGAGSLSIRLRRHQLLRYFGPHARISVYQAKWVTTTTWSPTEGLATTIRTKDSPKVVAFLHRDGYFMKDGEVWLVGGLLQRGRDICPALTNVAFDDLAADERMLAAVEPHTPDSFLLQETVVLVGRKARFAPDQTRKLLNRLALASEVVNGEDEAYVRVRWEGLPGDRLLHLVITSDDRILEEGPTDNYAFNGGSFAAKMQAGSGTLRFGVDRAVARRHLGKRIRTSTYLTDSRTVLLFNCECDWIAPAARRLVLPADLQVDETLIMGATFNSEEVPLLKFRLGLVRAFDIVDGQSFSSYPRESVVLPPIGQSVIIVPYPVRP